MSDFKFEAMLLMPLRRDRGKVTALFRIRPTGVTGNVTRHAIAIRPGDNIEAAIAATNEIFARQLVAPIAEADSEKLARSCAEAFEDEDLLAEAAKIAEARAAQLAADMAAIEKRRAQA